MANKFLVAGLLVAANLLFSVALGFLLQPCPIPPGADGDSSARPSPSLDTGAGSCDDPGFCLPVSRYVALGVAFVLGIPMGVVSLTIYQRFADDDDEEEASGDAMKAGHVAIRDDPEAGGVGGKN